MTDRLEADTELTAKPLDVVAQRLSRLQERAVGKDEGAGKVIRQPDAGERTRLLAGERRGLGEPSQQIVLLEEGELRRHLEGVLPRPQMRRQVQHLVGGIVAALESAGILAMVVAGIQRHAHTMHAGEMLGDHGVDPAGRELGGRELGGAIEPLRRLVEFGHVIVAGVEIVAHFLERRRWRRGRPVVAQARSHRLRAFHRRAITPVQHHQGAADRRHVGRKFADFGRSDGLAGLRVRQRVAQIGDQPRFLVVGEELNIDPEGGVDLQQDRDRERPLVGLELAQVAGREAQRRRQGRLGQAALLAQSSQPDPDEGLAHLTLSVFRKLRKLRSKCPQTYAISGIYLSAKIADIADIVP